MLMVLLHRRGVREQGELRSGLSQRSRRLARRAQVLVVEHGLRHGSQRVMQALQPRQAACTASASGWSITRIANTAWRVPWPTGKKIWRSARSQHWPAKASASAVAGQGVRAWRRGMLVVAGRRADGPDEALPAVARRWPAPPAAARPPAARRCRPRARARAAKSRPSLSSGAQCEGTQTHSQGRVPVAPSSTAKSSSNASSSGSWPDASGHCTAAARGDGSQRRGRIEARHGMARLPGLEHRPLFRVQRARADPAASGARRARPAAAGPAACGTARRSG